jgi:mevalonate kinase
MSVAASHEATRRANGKVILLGEHAVVYGYPAIALGLTSGAEAQVRRAAGSSLRFGTDAPVSLGKIPAPDEPPAFRAFRALLGALGAPPVEASLHLSIPAGAGLGASAALGVALARALCAAAGIEEASNIARSALVWENVFHGNASGIDTAAAELGGCLWFTRQTGAIALAPQAVIHVAVACVEPGASTRAMVEGVARRRAADATGVGTILDRISELVDAARTALRAGSLAELGGLMRENHQLLRALGVSTPGLDRACQLAMEAGAWGAKLTGAGGGGCVIALVDDERRGRVLDVWREQGFLCLEARADATS